ncbi:unnamed protein product [Blepharisma stoltei]|uniref:Uncharacterized protein n=1 Tax=Blepharisma stoltei TaxID=1481888 RepID=A0AAU9IHM5_9CILI|nr:unnamed protein product [Blepharisma stoltei]
MLGNCSLVPFKHKILITANNLDEYIYEYDISLENFSKIEIGKIKSKGNLLIAGNSRVYLLTGGNLWECKYGNQYVWNQIGAFNWDLVRSLQYSLSRMNYIRRKKNYFGVLKNKFNSSKFSFFEFNLNSKEFKESKL